MSKTLEPYIKVTCSLPDKAEIQVVADELCINDDEAFGLVVKFFIWLDSQMDEDGRVDQATPERVSRKFHRPGFGEAIVKAGWMLVDGDGDGIIIPNHDRHMGVSAKKRMYETERKRLQRRVDNVPFVSR